MNKLLLTLIPAILFAQDAKVEAKPQPPTDPITDKMRFDFAVAQRDYLNIKVQESTLMNRLEGLSAGMKSACENVDLSFSPQVNQFGCSPKQVSEADGKAGGRRMAMRADQKAGMPPADDAGEQRKKQMADAAAKKKAEEEAKKQAAEKQ